MDDFKKVDVAHLRDSGKREKATLRAVKELDNTCVCCGEIIPEGFMVCRNCLLED